MLLLDVMPRIRQEEDFRASAVFNDDPKWTTGNAAEDLFTSHTAELKGNNDLLTLTKVSWHLCAPLIPQPMHHAPDACLLSALQAGRDLLVCSTCVRAAGGPVACGVFFVPVQPAIINEIHQRYFEAGADICETNTFSGTWVAQVLCLVPRGVSGAPLLMPSRDPAPCLPHASLQHKLRILL